MTAVKSLRGINLPSFGSSVHLTGCSDVGQECIWVMLHLPCHLLTVLSNKVQVPPTLPVVPNWIHWVPAPHPYLLCSFSYAVVVKPRTICNYNLKLPFFGFFFSGGWGVMCRYALGWSFFPALSPSSHSSHTLTLNPQRHIFLYTHWRLHLIPLLQISTPVPCNLSIKRN